MFLTSHIIRDRKSKDTAANVERRTLDACTALGRRDVESRLKCGKQWDQHTSVVIMSSSLSDLFNDLSFTAQAVSLEYCGIVVFVTR